MSGLLFESIRKVISKAEPLRDSEFDQLALELFAYQFENNAVYRKFCERKGYQIQSWPEIPIMTTESFKKNLHYCFKPEQVAKIFRSSGTTAAHKSQHMLSARGLELYELSLWQTFARAFNLTEGQQLLYCVLTESPSESPNSSMVHMFEIVRKKLGAPENCYFLESGELQLKKLVSNLKAAIAQNIPCLIVGTAFSYVYLLDAGLSKLALPTGSALMETGGFKGRSREISKDELYKSLSHLFELPPWAIVGQYGMSELGTQYYDRCFAHESNAQECRFKEARSWSRVRIVNPLDLQTEVAIGEAGLIAIYDLANIDSLAFVLSGDIGIRRSNGQFEVLGRAASLSPKGCSLNTDLLLKPGDN